jgi:hypothetical protein
MPPFAKKPITFCNRFYTLHGTVQSLAALLNGHQAAYAVLCYGSLALVLALAASALRAPWTDAVNGQTPIAPQWTRGLLFLLALSATVVLFRLPNLLTDRMLEADECGHIVAAWSLSDDPVPWRGTDYGSSGPLNAYPLAAAFRLGLPVSIITSRLVLVALFLILIGSTYATLVKLGGQLAGVLPALALGLFVCLAADIDHTHYNSDSCSVALLAAALLLYVFGRDRPSGGPRLIYGAGLLLGAIPYAKLQAAPLGCFLALIFLIDLWRRRRAGPRSWTGFLAFSLGGISVPSAMTVVLLATGTWHDFITSYLGFAGSYGFQSAPRLLAAACAFCGPDVPWFLLYCLLVPFSLFCCLDRIPGSLPPRVRLLLGAFFGYLAAALFAVQAPKTGFTHYAVLVLHPLTLLLGVCVGHAANLLAAGCKAGHLRGPQAAIACLAAATLALVAVHIGRWRIEMPPEEGFFPTLMSKPGACWVPFLPIQPRQEFQAAKFIANHARPGDRLSVWGWAPNYFVFAGLPNATRYPATILAMPPTLITAGVTEELRAFYRRRYLDDLRRARPAFFLDAVSGAEFACQDRQIWGHETCPELARFIAENYVQVFEVVVAPGNGTRVYQLKDRLPK